MAVTSFANGTQTATVTTEHFVSDVNQAGTYVFEVNTTNMAAGDVLELRIYRKPLTGSTSVVAYFSAFYGVQPAEDVIKISVPISNDHTNATALRFSLKQTFGTGRNFEWNVLKHA